MTDRELLRHILIELRPVQKALEVPVLTSRERNKAMLTVATVREHIIKALAADGVETVDGGKTNG